MKRTAIIAFSAVPAIVAMMLPDVCAMIKPTQRLSNHIDTSGQLIAMKMPMFVSGEHPTSGSVSVVREGENKYIEFGEDFKTDSGPDLFVILHKNKDVIGTTKAPTHSIKEGDYVTLEPLKKVKGKQRYKIPSEVNLENYKSVAIWCRQFNATFGAATLPQ